MTERERLDMKLLIASNNANKVLEIRQILAPHFDELVSMRDAGLDIDVVEDGETFVENAIKKATEVLAMCGYDAVLADDSGLCVDALNGEPGVRSARFAEGFEHDVPKNNAKLVSLMRDVPDDKRQASFVCAVALARRGRPVLCVQGSCSGRILREARGSNGFGYDPYFYFPEFGKSFAELDSVTKNSISHRHNALSALEEALRLEGEKL